MTTKEEMKNELLERLHETYRNAILLMAAEGRSPGVIATNLIHTYGKGKMLRRSIVAPMTSPSEDFTRDFMSILAAAYYYPEWMAAWVGALNTEMADELRDIADDLVMQLPFLPEMSEAAS